MGSLITGVKAYREIIFDNSSGAKLEVIRGFAFSTFSQIKTLLFFKRNLFNWFRLKCILQFLFFFNALLFSKLAKFYEINPFQVDLNLPRIIFIA